MAELVEESEGIEEATSRCDLEREFAEWNEPDCFGEWNDKDMDAALYKNETSYKDLFYDPSRKNGSEEVIRIKGIFSDRYFSSVHDLLVCERDTNGFDLEKIIISAVEDDDGANTSSSKEKPYNCMVTVVLIINFIRSQMQQSEPPPQSASALLQQLSTKEYLLDSEKYMVSVDRADLLLPLLLDHFSALLSPDEDGDDEDDDDDDEDDREEGVGNYGHKLQAAREKVENFDEIMTTLNSSED